MCAAWNCQADTTQNDAEYRHVPYSVLMSVYAKDNPMWFEQAVVSMVNQSWKPDEIIIMQDGPVGFELKQTIDRCSERHTNLVRIIELSHNVGLGEAMRQGMYECRNEWIARMDSDDISDSKRCEEELTMALRMNADIVGCDCIEFFGDISTPSAKRVFPESHEELIRFSRRKVPFCHPAVMMKKSVVLRAGNYRAVFPHDDYDLFVRMLANGAVGCTIKKFLFYVRVSSDFYERRGGWKYMITLLKFNVELLDMGWMKPVDFFARSCGNVLFSMMPKSVRGWMYRRLLRK